MQFDQLDELLARVTVEIREKQAVILRLTDEVQRLQQQASSLEVARALLMNEAVQRDVDQQKALAVGSIRLQDEILKCLAVVDAVAGVPMAQVANMLKEGGYPNSDRPSFYANVFTTLRRLVAKGRVIENSVGQTKLYSLGVAPSAGSASNQIGDVS